MEYLVTADDSSSSPAPGAAGHMPAENGLTWMDYDSYLRQINFQVREEDQMLIRYCLAKPNQLLWYTQESITALPDSTPFPTCQSSLLNSILLSSVQYTIEGRQKNVGAIRGNIGDYVAKSQLFTPM
jgi:hypothetical protein